MGIRGYGLFIVLSLFMVDLHADEGESTSSSISLELGRDSDDAKEGYLDLDTSLTNDIHIRWMSGGSKLDGESDVFETRSRTIGISSDYGAPFVAGFDYDYWGSPESVETRTRRFKVGANTENWYVQLLYEDRTTRLYTRGVTIVIGVGVITLPDYYDINSIGRGIDISYYGLYRFAFNVSYIEYDYDKDVSALQKYPGYYQKFFFASTLSVATGLESWRRAGDISYSYDWGAVGFSGSQSESAVDESVASTVSIYLIWDFVRNWSSTFTWGESGTDTTDETVRFGRVALTHRW